MIIRTDYDKLSALVTTLQNQLQEYASTYNSINSHLNDLSDWTGKDKSAFVEQAGILKENIDRMLDNVNTLAENVRSGATKYSEASNIVSPHASRF